MTSRAELLQVALVEPALVYTSRVISRAKLNGELQGAWPRPILAASRSTPANRIPARARLPLPHQTQEILKEVRQFGDCGHETPPHLRLQEPRQEKKRKSPVPSD